MQIAFFHFQNLLKKCTNKSNNDFPKSPEQSDKEKKALWNVFIPSYKAKINLSYLSFLKLRH